MLNAEYLMRDVMSLKGQAASSLHTANRTDMMIKASPYLT